jgi:hypothetical protein
MGVLPPAFLPSLPGGVHMVFPGAILSPATPPPRQLAPCCLPIPWVISLVRPWVAAGIPACPLCGRLFGVSVL